MSRSCTAEDVGLRQHRGRLLQLAEANSVGSSNSNSANSGGTSASKRRAYSAQHSLFKSLQQMTAAAAAQHNASAASTLPAKLLSFEQVIKNRLNNYKILLNST